MTLRSDTHTIVIPVGSKIERCVSKCSKCFPERCTKILQIGIPPPAVLTFCQPWVIEQQKRKSRPNGTAPSQTTVLDCKIKSSLQPRSHLLLRPRDSIWEVFLKKTESIHLISNYLVIRDQHFWKRPQPIIDLISNPRLCLSSKDDLQPELFTKFPLGLMFIIHFSKGLNLRTEDSFLFF